MNRYLIECTLADGLPGPSTSAGSAAGGGVEANAGEGVTWIHSYIAADRRKIFCLCDGPSPEAIRKAVERNGLPVDAVIPVMVLDPYFYVLD
jgi:hypothetical protein